MYDFIFLLSDTNEGYACSDIWQESTELKISRLFINELLMGSCFHWSAEFTPVCY